MRCLECGNQLALLKKFTDGEFCSAEHRTLFFDNQQKVIMERLASSALRFKRQKKQLKSNRLPEPVPVAPGENLPPIAKMAQEFVLDRLYIRNPQFAAPTPMPAISGAGRVINYPPSRSLVKSLDFGMAGPIYEFEFAREWTGRRSSPQLLDSASRLRPILPVAPQFYTVDGGSIRGLHGTRNPLRMRPRGPVQDPSVAAFHKLEVKLAEALVPEPPTIPALSIGRLPAGTPFAATRFFRSKPKGPIGDALPIDLERIKASHNPASSGTAALPRMADAKMPDLSPSGLAGRVDTHGLHLSLDAMEASVANSGPVEFASFPSGFAHPMRPAAAPGVCGLLFLDHALGEPAARPLDADGLPRTDSDYEKQVESFESGPIPAAMNPDGMGDCAPNLVRRFFRTVPKGHAGADSLAAFESIPHGTGEALLSSPVHATLPLSMTEVFRAVHNENSLRLFGGAGVSANASGTSDKIPSGLPLTLSVAPANAKLPVFLAGECAPRPVLRFFKARPRGPVPSGAAEGFAGISSGYSPNLPGKPAIAPLPAYLAGECAPSPAVRFFKARPRGPVPSRVSAEFEQIGAGSPPELLSKPLTGTSSAWSAVECAPGQVIRLFKARPRGPVSSQIVVEQIAERGPAELLSKPLKGTLPASSAVECAPRDMGHLLKMNLPSAVTTGVGELEAIPGSSQPLHSSPATMTMSQGVPGECSPAPQLRFFKSRPRGPIQLAASAGFERIATSAPLNLLRHIIGTLPAGVIGECSPKPVAQVVHQNPQGPVAADAGDIEKSLGDSLSLLSRPAIAALPPGGMAACSPNPIVRFFRARPRGPVDAETKPLAGDASPNLAAQSENAQSMPALPRIAPGETAPSILDRQLQVTPLAGVSGGSLCGDAIDSGFAVAIAVTPVLASLPSGIIGELAPAFREKLYRMKPRGAVQSPELATLQQIPCGGPAELCQKGAAPRLFMGEGLDFAPNFLNRFYKMRPRGPIQGQSTVMEALQAGHPETLQSRASIPGMPAVLMRQARTPSKERTYWPGPPGPRPNSGSTSLKQNDGGKTDTRVSQASMSALPESDSPTPAGIREALRESRKRGVIAHVSEFWSEGGWGIKWLPRSLLHFFPCLSKGNLPILQQMTGSRPLTSDFRVGRAF